MTDAYSAISSQVARLAVSVDNRDWSGLMQILDAEIRIDYSALSGEKAQSVTRDSLIATWRQLLPGFSHTSHVIGVPAITIRGDTAQVSASFAAFHTINDVHVEGGNVWTVHGCYEMTFINHGAAWRISALTLARAWVEGNPSLPAIAGERARHNHT